MNSIISQAFLIQSLFSQFFFGKSHESQNWMGKLTGTPQVRRHRRRPGRRRAGGGPLPGGGAPRGGAGGAGLQGGGGCSWAQVAVEENSWVLVIRWKIVDP